MEAEVLSIKATRHREEEERHPPVLLHFIIASCRLKCGFRPTRLNMARNYVRDNMPLSRFGVLVAQLESTVASATHKPPTHFSSSTSYPISSPPLMRSQRLLFLSL
ncbi:unnamed protein product [Fraxinus pennsylvanica]|uniref:Uncharacterized protein n=1 Tax=Fraxinus pennsylvanica TaxID=56036 RepID=A0AAD1ZNX7_9LAMI|nr:unnamed protein product [Fraxinus pennsylvanica]